MAVNKLLPIVYSALTSFPYIEKDFDALTQYEIIQAIIKKINEIVPFVNEMKDGVEQVVTDLLTEWKNDGTLDQIINKAFLSTNKNIDVRSQMWGTKLIDNPINDGLSYTVQGSHCDGSFWYYALLNESSGKVIIYKMTMNGTIINYAVFSGGILGHANGMTGGLDDDTIAVVTTDKLVMIDSVDLTINTVISLETINNYCIATNKTDNVYYIYNGDVIQVYDKNGNIQENIYFHVTPNPEAGTIKQGCAYNPDDGRLYLIYSDPGFIYSVNIENPEDVIYISIGFEFWSGGEIEDGSFIDGDFYFTSSWINNCGNRHIRFWYTNFTHGVKPIVPYASYITGVNMGDLKVDSGTNDFRPNGTSTHPFARIGDALEFGNAYIDRKNDSDFVIDCSGESNLGRISIHNQKNSVLIKLNSVPSDVIFGINCAGTISIRNCNIVSNVNNNDYLIYCLRCAKFIVNQGLVDPDVTFGSNHPTNIAESNAYIYDICTPTEYENNGNSYISNSTVITPINVYRSILQTNNVMRSDDYSDITNGMVVTNGGIAMHDGYVNVTAWE